MSVLNELEKSTRKSNPCNMVFSQHLEKLLKERGLSNEELRRELGKFYEKDRYSASYISQITTGTTSPSKQFIIDVAKVTGVDEEELLCRAGRPSDEVLLALAQNPNEVLSLIRKTVVAKIGVVRILWAALIYAVPESNSNLSINTKFECLEYDMGKDALNAMFEGEVQFATVTREAVEKHQQKNDVFFVLDFFSSKRKDLYSLYKLLPEVSREDGVIPKYAYLSNSILSDIAQDEEQHKKRGHQFKGVPVDTIADLVKAIKNKKVNGFYGWPPLDAQVLTKLKGIEGNLDNNPQEYELKEKEIQAFNPPSTTLHLVTTNDYIQRAGCAVMADLTFRIISAKSTSEEKIWETLKKRMPYISKAHRQKLKGVTFDVNIEPGAFQRMMMERSLWLTSLRNGGI